MNKTIYLLLLLFINGFAASAQQQLFNDPDPAAPAYDFDVLRSQNADIQLISKTAGEWTNYLRITTAKHPMNPDLFTEKGFYIYNNAVNSWLPNYVFKFDINYNPTTKQVRHVKEERIFYDPTNNYGLNYNYVFNDKGIDSMSAVQIGKSIPSYTKKYYYDTTGKLHKNVLSYYGSNSYTSYYFYDDQNRINLMVTIYTDISVKKTDTFSRVMVTYSPTNKIRSYVTQNYQLQNSPLTWTTLKRIDYFYDAADNVAKTNYSKYNDKKDYQETTLGTHTFKYNSSGKITEHVQILFDEYEFLTNKDSLVITYKSPNQADSGYNYTWDGSSYSTEPDVLYLFSNTITGLPNTPNSPAVDIYPNPFNDYIHLEAYTNDKSDITITDMVGKTVLTQSYTSEINTSHLPPGFYFLNIGTTKSIKIIKQ